MKNLFIIFLLFISIATYSQTASDSIFQTQPNTSIVVQNIDTIQFQRIEYIENSLSAYYSSNRLYHSLLFISVGLSLASFLVANTEENPAGARMLQLGGGVIGIIGTVVYLDSFKFLNFKKKHKQLLVNTYY